MDKSSIFFSKSTSENRKKEICDILEGVSIQRNSKYLGLPLVLGRSKKNVFASIRKRVTKKKKNWKSKFLIAVGKEVLLKLVIQALPVYTMFVFKLPKGLYQELTKLMANFWWSNGDNEKRMHWNAWDTITEAKEKGGLGGLGFKDLQAFNVALLCKQVWRLIIKPNLLMSKVLKQKYFPKDDLFQVKSKVGDSWMWKSWIEAAFLLKKKM